MSNYSRAELLLDCLFCCSSVVIDNPLCIVLGETISRVFTIFICKIRCYIHVYETNDYGMKLVDFCRKICTGMVMYITITSKQCVHIKVIQYIRQVKVL